ncbi:nucleoside monophosphate kinase [candidate division WWE3 bacterium]|nr:nucleoside monophosphate kinase [candidate division WWE3 bacterium]
MNILINGPQGSGKTTQARLLAKKLDLNLLDSGSMLRSSADSEDGKRAKEFIDKGIYVPEELYFRILKNYVESTCDSNKGFVFTGFPRTLKQVPLMENSLEIKLDKVFDLKVGSKEYLKRIRRRAQTEKRSDESPKAVKLRLEQHEKKTGPVLDFYRQRGIVVEINGEGPIAKIHQEIMSKL